MADLLAQRTITWQDATTETVVIGDDYFFTLDGIKKKLIGLDFTLYCPTVAEAHQWCWHEATNMTYFETQLAYLQSMGIRLIRPQVFDTWPDYLEVGSATEEAAYVALYDLFEKYKMLVIPSFFYSWKSIWDAQFNAQMINGGGAVGYLIWAFGVVQELLSTFIERVMGYLSDQNYNNIVAINCENELDNYKDVGDSYHEDDVAVYMTWLIALAHTYFPGVPTTHNLSLNGIPGDAWYPAPSHPAIKAVIRGMVDIPAYDMYRNTPALMKADFDTYFPQYGVTNWWGQEIGYEANNNQNLITVQHLDQAFKSGATVAMFFRNIDITGNLSFFNTDGTPKDNLKLIAAYRQSLEKIGNLI